MASVQSCWIQVPGQGFVPSYRFFGLVAEGAPRPYRRFFQGEREGIARYFMCLICETLFGEAPLRVMEDDEGKVSFQSNPDWDNEPFMRMDEAGNYVMSDGSSLFDVTFEMPSTADQDGDSETPETTQ
jgi:hypothetical protein